MTNKAPAFQFYAADYLADINVQMLSLEEEGAYIRLLAYCWREGSIPSAPESLTKLCKNCSTDVITVVKRLFNEAPNDPIKLIHQRLEEEREKQKAYREQQSKAGKKSAEVRAKCPKIQRPLEPLLQRPLEQALNGNPSLQSSSSSSASKLAREQTEKKEPPQINPSKNEELIASPSAAAVETVPDIAHEIYRHYPIQLHDNKALAAIQTALKVVDGQILLSAVKAYAEMVERTNTERPTWPEKWFNTEMWKSYLPVDEPPATSEITHSPKDDQDLSPFGDDFYQTLNKH